MTTLHAKLVFNSSAGSFKKCGICHNFIDEMHLALYDKRDKPYTIYVHVNCRSGFDDLKLSDWEYETMMLNAGALFDWRKLRVSAVDYSIVALADRTM